MVTELLTSPIAAQRIADYEVKCEFFVHGCPVAMKFGLIKEHGDQCEFDYVTVIAEKDNLLKKYVDEVSMLNKLLKGAELEVGIANSKIGQLSLGLRSNTNKSTNQGGSGFVRAVPLQIGAERNPPKVNVANGSVMALPLQVDSGIKPRTYRTKVPCSPSLPPPVACGSPTPQNIQPKFIGRGE